MNTSYKVSILIVDDHFDSRFAHQRRVAALFKEVDSEELNIKPVANIEDMYKALKQESFHVVLLDRDLGKDSGGDMIDGIEQIPRILEIRPNSRILILTSYNDTSLAVRAMQLGAKGFMTKSSEEENERYCDEQILQALRESQLEIDLLTKNLSSTRISSYICESEAMKDIDDKLKSLASVDATVLILGESGLGKTHAAKRLNLLSKESLEQRQRPFVNININAIPKNLQEAELFGSEKGSYTGSHERRQGYFELAAGGDLFLDEIGDASPELQGALLKAIEEKQFRRVGGQQELKMNARLIFATNKNLEKMVETGEFRKDLYARICAIKIEMPPLSERKADIPYICQNICETMAKENNQPFSFTDFPRGLQEYFLRDNIPYNIRGIRNGLERLLIFCPVKSNGKRDYTKWRSILNHTMNINYSDVVMAKDINSLTEELAQQLSQPGGVGLPKAQTLLERLAIEMVGKIHKTNKDQAAALGISASLLTLKKNKFSTARG